MSTRHHSHLLIKTITATRGHLYMYVYSHGQVWASVHKHRDDRFMICAPLLVLSRSQYGHT